LHKERKRKRGYLHKERKRKRGYLNKEKKREREKEIKLRMDLVRYRDIKTGIERDSKEKLGCSDYLWKHIQVYKSLISL